MVNFVEETCLCGRIWRGLSGCSLACEVCGVQPIDEQEPDIFIEDEEPPIDEDALEEYQHEQRRKLAERNEY